MRRVNYDEPIKNFPDAFAKDKESNNYKLLQIHKESSDEILKVLRDTFGAFAIDNAYGATLDLWYGEKFVLKRGRMSDEQYRIRLKGKIMQNATDGTHARLVQALSQILQCEKSDIRIVESENSNSVIVKDIPLGVLIKADFSTQDILELINNLLPANVRICEYGFTGSFEFDGNENVYDEEKGFADTDGEIGGYLGLMERMRV